MSIGETLLWQGIGLVVGALTVGWRPWHRIPPPIRIAPLDPTPPTLAEITRD